MSVYFECRFDNVVLDLSTRSDIRDWLCDVYRFRHTDDETIEPRLPESLTNFSRTRYLSNNFTNGLDVSISCSGDLTTLDVCIGNKNKNHDIEKLIFELLPYIKSGRIYVDNEIRTYEVSIERTRETSAFPHLVSAGEDGIYERFYTGL